MSFSVVLPVSLAEWVYKKSAENSIRYTMEEAIRFTLESSKAAEELAILKRATQEISEQEINQAYNTLKASKK
jgi:hypothetical protein